MAGPGCDEVGASPRPPRTVNINLRDDQNLQTSLTKAFHRRQECGDDGEADGGTQATQPSTPFASPMSSVSSHFSANETTTGMADGHNSARMADDPGPSDHGNLSSHAVEKNGNVIGSSGSSDDDDGKSMEVTITVLSLHGIVAKKKGGKRKAQHKKNDKEMATVVASFSQNISKDRVFLTHVPSLPVPLNAAAAASNAALDAATAAANASIPSSPASISSTSSSKANANGNDADGEVVQPVVHWPNTDGDRSIPGDALSTLQFQRKFIREGSRNDRLSDRFVPQTCPINLSVSRNGKMALLGKVDLIINGEERGETSCTVPITSSIRTRKRDQVKKIQSSLKGRQGGGGGRQQGSPMVKIKGDKYQFGLEFPMLRVLVNVRDPDAGDRGAVDQTVRTEDNGCKSDGNKGDETDQEEDDDSVSDNECLSVEGEDSSLLECDDYYNMNPNPNRHVIESNELRTLQQQLARSEQTNNILHMELANAQFTAGLASRYMEENARLRMDLQESTQRCETLTNELSVARSESEALPYFEARVGELSEELRRRDLEVECLKEEICDLKECFKEQLVDSVEVEASLLPSASPPSMERARSVEALLWDHEDDEDRSMAIEGGEVPEREEGMPDKWGARRLGVTFRAEVEEKIIEPSDEDEDGREVEEESLNEAETPEASPEVNYPLPEEQGNLTDEMRNGEPPSEVDEDVGSPTRGEGAGLEGNETQYAVAFEDLSPNSSGATDDSTDDVDINRNDSDEKESINDAAAAPSSAKQARGWGIRGIGASLRAAEERMRERQAKFREQQLREQRAAEQKARDAAAAAGPGLGGALISRFSNHGTKEATDTAIPSGEIAEGNEERAAAEEGDAEENDEKAGEEEGAPEEHAEGPSTTRRSDDAGGGGDDDRATTPQEDATPANEDSSPSSTIDEASENEAKSDCGKTDWAVISESMKRLEEELRSRKLAEGGASPREDGAGSDREEGGREGAVRTVAALAGAGEDGEASDDDGDGGSASPPSENAETPTVDPVDGDSSKEGTRAGESDGGGEAPPEEEGVGETPAAAGGPPSTAGEDEVESTVAGAIAGGSPPPARDAEGRDERTPSEEHAVGTTERPVPSGAAEVDETENSPPVSPDVPDRAPNEANRDGAEWEPRGSKPSEGEIAEEGAAGAAAAPPVTEAADGEPPSSAPSRTDPSATVAGDEAGGTAEERPPSSAAPSDADASDAAAPPTIGPPPPLVLADSDDSDGFLEFLGYINSDTANVGDKREGGRTDPNLDWNDEEIPPTAAVI